MSLVKKIVGAWAVKEGVEWVAERRQPRRSGGFKKLLILAGLGGGAYYLYSTGKLQPLLEKVAEVRNGETGVSEAV